MNYRSPLAPWLTQPLWRCCCCFYIWWTKVKSFLKVVRTVLCWRCNLYRTLSIVFPGMLFLMGGGSEITIAILLQVISVMSWAVPRDYISFNHNYARQYMIHYWIYNSSLSPKAQSLIKVLDCEKVITGNWWFSTSYSRGPACLSVPLRAVWAAWLRCQLQGPATERFLLKSKSMLGWGFGTRKSQQKVFPGIRLLLLFFYMISELCRLSLNSSGWNAPLDREDGETVKLYFDCLGVTLWVHQSWASLL